MWRNLTLVKERYFFCGAKGNKGHSCHSGDMVAEVWRLTWLLMGFVFSMKCERWSATEGEERREWRGVT
jgi:hypothetical protein